MSKVVTLTIVILAAYGCTRRPESGIANQAPDESRLVQLLGHRRLLPVSNEQGKFGYINRSGETIIAPTFGIAGEFLEERALVCVGDCKYVERKETDTVTLHEFQGKFGFIDESGKFISQAQFDSAEAFSEGLAGVCLGRGCRDFKIGNSGPDGLVERWGFVDRSGQLVVNPQFEWVGGFSEGFAPFCPSACDDLNTKRVGFLDKVGGVVIPAQFTNADGFWDGISQVVIGRGQDRRVGYINQKGEYVMIPHQWPE